MTPEQQELTQRIRRRAFRGADKRAALRLLRLADEVAQMRFARPPRVLLEQFRDEDPFMADLDLPKPRAGRAPRRTVIYEALVGGRRLLIERERGGELTVRLSGGGEEFIVLDEVQERRLRKAFAVHPATGPA